jgi:hypothetical protein
VAGNAPLQPARLAPPPGRRLQLVRGPRPLIRPGWPQGPRAVATAVNVLRGPRRHPLRRRLHRLAALRQRLELLLATVGAVTLAGRRNAAPRPPHGARGLPHLGVQRWRTRRAPDLPWLVQRGRVPGLRSPHLLNSCPPNSIITIGKRRKTQT